MAVHRAAQNVIVSSLLVGLVGLVALAATPSQAGPLDPPPGPIGPTSKPLAEVEARTAVNAANTPGGFGSLFTITQPGSYYLTGNVAGESGKCGVEITASNVTLDLNGFALAGVAGSLDAIRVTGATARAVSVSNGSITGWGEDGIEFFATSMYSVVDVRVSLCTGVGIKGGSVGRIGACAVRSNGSHGITSNEQGIIESCTAFFNGGAGIRASFGECVITNCVTRGNTVAGIEVGYSCLVRDNECALSSGPGILVTSTDNRIEGNNVDSTTLGIQVTSPGNLILRNSVTNAGTPYSFVANNRYGQIVNISGGGAAAVNGPSAASTLTTTDPWANFTY